MGNCRPQEKCRECLCWKCTDHKDCDFRGIFPNDSSSCGVVLKCSRFNKKNMDFGGDEAHKGSLTVVLTHIPAN